ncbi:hypothetical protein [Burkholderia pseudomultivorans]|uniref:hypothetical protein n=1 Tax=Burkholderia pseudomultivorans TaxID=1207504 RepID=UPI000770DFEB|nr:hypothetical protein [Burkholderia pseudomultivorans]KWF05328.1 hypothetical protein WT55_23105 [Burkholderia pseudomultivorans]
MKAQPIISAFAYDFRTLAGRVEGPIRYAPTRTGRDTVPVGGAVFFDEGEHDRLNRPRAFFPNIGVRYDGLAPSQAMLQRHRPVGACAR